MEWVHTEIPKPIAQRIEKEEKMGISPIEIFIPFSTPCFFSLIIKMTLGYSSIASFVTEAVRRHLEIKEREYDEITGDQELGRKVRTGE